MKWFSWKLEGDSFRLGSSKVSEESFDGLCMHLLGTLSESGNLTHRETNVWPCVSTMYTQPCNFPRLSV